MICRMNKRQREALIELIRTMIDEAKEGTDTHEVLARMQAEEDFHNCFENESEIEDTHNHVERT